MDGPYISTCLCAFAMGTIIVHYCRWLPCQWIFPFVSVYKSDLTPPRVSIPKPRHFIVPVSSDDSQSVRRISSRPRQMCHEQLMKLLIKFTGFKPTAILTCHFFKEWFLLWNVLLSLPTFHTSTGMETFVFKKMKRKF